MSTSLNHAAVIQGTVDKSGKDHTTQMDVQNYNSQKNIYYVAKPKDCGSNELNDNRTVEQVIDQAFDPKFTKNFAYVGQDYAEWDNKTKYNRINVFNPEQ